jgi:hypothetical protein
MRLRSVTGPAGIAATVAIVLAGLASAPAASAVVYCVPDDSVDAACEMPQATVQGALAAAQGSGAVADSVLIGPGTFTESLSYSTLNPANTVQVIGRGVGDTVLVPPNTVGANLHFVFQSPAGSTVSDLSKEIPANADGGGETGLSLSGGAGAERIQIEGPMATNSSGIQLSGGSTVADSVIDLQATVFSGNRAIGGGGGTVTDSTLRTENGATLSGGVTTLLRTRIEAHVGVIPDSGTVEVRDSLIELDGANNAVGVQLENLNNGATAINGTVDGTTIVGGGMNSIGVKAVGNSTNAGENATATVTNTLISGPLTPLAALADQGESATITSDYSNYEAAANTVDDDISNGGDTGTAAINQTNQTNLAPGFVNPGMGDYHLTSTSPLLDIGDPAAPMMGALDFEGDPRALSMTGTCAGPVAGRRDIGADEFAPGNPPECNAPPGMTPMTPAAPLTPAAPAVPAAPKKCKKGKKRGAKRRKKCKR